MPPFGRTPDTILFALVCDRQTRPPKPSDPETEIRGLDDDFWGLITRCWAHEPNERLEASEVAKALVELCSKPPKNPEMPVPSTEAPLPMPEPELVQDRGWRDFEESLKHVGVLPEAIEQNRPFIQNLVAGATKPRNRSLEADSSDSPVSNPSQSLVIPAEPPAPERVSQSISQGSSSSLRSAASMSTPSIKRSPLGMFYGVIGYMSLFSHKA